MAGPSPRRSGFGRAGGTNPAMTKDEMMFAPKPNARPAQLNSPVIETPRLLLRQWRSADIAPSTAMLGDPATARFITVDGKPVEFEMTVWRHAVVMAGHWAIHV